VALAPPLGVGADVDAVADVPGAALAGAADAPAAPAGEPVGFADLSSFTGVAPGAAAAGSADAAGALAGFDFVPLAP
jgi:hypothetical protein